MQSDRTERLNVHAHPLTVRAHGELFKIQKEKEVSLQNNSVHFFFHSMVTFFDFFAELLKLILSSIIIH